MLKLKDQDNPVVHIYGLKVIGSGKKTAGLIAIVMDAGSYLNAVKSSPRGIGKQGEKENIGYMVDGINPFTGKMIIVFL